MVAAQLEGIALKPGLWSAAAGMPPWIEWAATRIFRVRRAGRLGHLPQIAASRPGRGCHVAVDHESLFNRFSVEGGRLQRLR